MKTQDFCLSEDCTIYVPIGDNIIIPAGTFVNPIDMRWVPKHVIDDTRWRWFNKDKHVYVYCYLGIVPVDKDKIRTI